MSLKQLVPAAIEALAPVEWPLHVRLVFERIVQPESATFGAPLNVIDLIRNGLIVTEGEDAGPIGAVAGCGPPP